MASQPVDPLHFQALTSRIAELETENQQLRQFEAHYRQTQPSMLAAEQAKSQELEHIINAELRQTLTELEGRDRISEATVATTNALLTNEILDDAVNRALQIIGEALHVDRVAVLEHFFPTADSALAHWQVIYEWDAPGVISQIDNPHATQGSYEGIEEWYESLSQGKGLSYLLEEMPEPFRSGQREIGVKALHGVPIMIDGQFWGTVGIDNCREAKRISEAELSVLKVAADCIGSAIQRERLRLAELQAQKAALQAEQALRKAEQDRAAELLQANQALKNSLDSLAAEPSLDAFLGNVLTEISQQLNIQTIWFYLYEPIDQTLQLHRWVKQGEVQSPDNFSQLGPMANPIAVANLPIWEHLQKTRTPFVIMADNAEQAEQFMLPGTQDWQLQWAKQNNIQSGVNILLMLGETPLGLLGLLSAQRSEYTSEELALVQALTHQATLAIQLTRLADEAKQTALLDERNRMAREVHDTLAQAFTGVLMQLEATKRKINSAQLTVAQDHIVRARSLAQAGLGAARRSVHALRPQALDSNDLSNALQHLAEQMTDDTPVQIEVDIQGVICPLANEIEDNLLCIAQEALTNALRHAEPSLVRLRLGFSPNQVQLQVLDDGRGFDPQLQFGKGFGLISMQERSQRLGGEFNLTSRLGEGTTVIVTIPLRDSFEP